MSERTASKPNKAADGKSKSDAKAKKVLDKRSSSGWLTSDED